MNKLSYILIALVLTLLILIGVTVYVKNKNATPITLTPVYTDFSVTLPTKSGPQVTVPNFLTNADVKADPQNPGLYLVGNTFPTAPASSSPTFVVSYEKTSGYFNVTLLTKPLLSARTDAETYIKKLLKLDETSLCNLSYTVSVPGYVDENASGVDYRFSFCLDSVTLQ